MNRSFLKNLLDTVTFHAMSRPGITAERLAESFGHLLSPVHVRELLEVSDHICLRFDQCLFFGYVLSCKSKRLMKSSSTELAYHVLYAPLFICLITCSFFVCFRGYSQH